MSISLIIYWIFSALVLGIVVLALWKGGPPERMGASVILGVIIVGEILAFLLPHRFHPVLYLANDGLVAAGLLVVALRYASFWLGGAMLVYAVLFTLHAIYFVIGKEPDTIFIDINNFAYLGVAICLGIGTFVSWRQRVRARQAAAD